MIVEMLAADEVASTDAKALAATGFIGRNWYKFDRNVWMFDLVEHTGQAFLGLTLKCCRCHDHKFDPVSQEEYFRFRAFFKPHDVRTDRLNAATETEKDATLGPVLKDGVARVFDKQLDVKTFLFQRGDNRYPDESRPLPSGVPSALRGELPPIQTVSLPVEAFYPSLRPELADGLIEQARAGVTSVEKEIAAAAARDKAQQLEIRIATLVPSPPPVLEETKTVGERTRVRGPSAEQTSQPQAAAERTPHPNPLPSKARGEGTRIDPTNKYLWRMNSRRMEAEVVRDSVLFVAGSLDATRGGPEIPEVQGQTSLRRSLYFRNTPNEKMKFLELFDVADPNGCYRRKESVVPQQALALMNSALALDQSRLLAEKLTKQVGDKNDEPTNSAFIAAAFATILSQSPTEAELAASRRFLHDHTQLVATSNQAFFPAGGQSQRGPSAVPAQRARENLVHVLFSHNAFVTVR